MITTILSKFKIWFFAGIGIVMAGLAFYAKIMHDSAEKAKDKAKQKTKEAEDATELSNTYSELNRVDKKAEERKNEALKNRDTSEPVAGRNFNRNRMHDNGDTD